MPSDKVIAKGIAKGYAGDDYESTVRMLQRAASAARADERASFIEHVNQAITDQRNDHPSTVKGRVQRNARLVLLKQLIAWLYA